MGGVLDADQDARTPRSVHGGQVGGGGRGGGGGGGGRGGGGRGGGRTGPAAGTNITPAAATQAPPVPGEEKADRERDVPTARTPPTAAQAAPVAAAQPATGAGSNVPPKPKAPTPIDAGTLAARKASEAAAIKAAAQKKIKNIDPGPMIGAGYDGIPRLKYLAGIK